MSNRYIGDLSASSEVILTADNAINSRLVSAPDSRKYGADATSDGFSVRIGNRPLVYDLADLYVRNERTLPPTLASLRGEDKLLLVLSSASVMPNTDKSVVRDLRMINYEVEHDPKSYVTVVDIAPQARFLETINGKIKTDLSTRVGITTSGAFTFLDSLQHQNGAAHESISAPGKNQPVVNAPGLTGELNVLAENQLVAELAFRVATPLIEAVGAASDHCQWLLRLGDDPLLGQTHMFAQTLFVPSWLDTLKFRVRVTATSTAPFGLLPRPLRTGWKSLSVPVPPGRETA